MKLGALFPSLSKPLASSRLLGLYFASSWCPDCTPVTPALGRVYAAQSPSDEGIKELEIVYVSSDRSVEQMNDSMQKSHGPWQSIPYENVEERSSLKCHFGVCAGMEASALGLTNGKRKFGIPTLIIIDCATDEILSMDGVGDVMKSSDGTGVIAGWIGALPN
mmetsp:Transcript_16388/g.25572  ORF Transcript_16388/g.25572 Transcript_16388/m.25572 type:complete len:163 (-) Transcript_16388:29-517(-)